MLRSQVKYDPRLCGSGCGTNNRWAFRAAIDPSCKKWASVPAFHGFFLDPAADLACEQGDGMRASSEMAPWQVLSLHGLILRLKGQSMSPTPPVFTDVPSCETYLKKMLDENNIEPKKTKLQFVWNEFVALVAQVMVFGFAFALASNFFTDKDRAVQIFASRVGNDSMSELWMLGLGILLVIGFLSVVSKAAPAAQTYIDDFVFEIPRAIYAFGASATAACICLALYVRAHSIENLGVSAIEALKLAAGMLLVSFIYGCAISFVFKRNALK